jgi:P4 family phage/plasmid primase-like protien
MNSIDFKQLSQQLLSKAESILIDICPGGKRSGNYYHAGTTQGGEGKSFYFNFQTGAWRDGATDENGGDIIALYAHNKGINQVESAKELSEKYLGKTDIKLSVPTKPPQIIKKTKLIKPPPDIAPPTILNKYHAHYKYTDETGYHIFYIVRKNNPDETKDFYPFSYSDDNQWVSKISDDLRVPYNLHEIVTTNKKILIVEGEKAADSVKRWLQAYTVTAWSGGAQASLRTNWDSLKDKDVLLWPDHDKKKIKDTDDLLPYDQQPGIRAMRSLAEHLKNICNSVKILEIGIDPEKKDGWDAADAEEEGWNQSKFLEWAKPIARLIEKEKPKTKENENYRREMSKKYETFDTGFYFTYEDEKGNEVQKPDYDGLAHFLKEEINLKCDESLRYVYDGKKYLFVNDLGLKNLANKYLKKNISPNAVSSFSNKAQIICYSDLSQIDFESGFLNCNNGVLDVVNRELKPHSPDVFFKYVLEHDYNPDAECPIFLNSLNLITKGDTELQKLIQQVFGYCIEGGHPKAEKFFVFLGGGGNGKSTILTALRNLIGLSNISSIPVSLLDRPFSAISLDGKLANLSDETPKFSKNGEILKNIVTGGYIRAAHKGMDEIDLKCNARLIFACNKTPNFGDDSDGMMRRIVTIPFNHKIDDKEADRNISQKIKAEMSGVLNWALDGLKELMDNDYKFIMPKSVEESNEALRQETDSAYGFLREYLEFLAGPNGENVYESRSDIYDAYNHYCKRSNLLAISARAFGEKLNQFLDGERKISNHEPLDRRLQKFIDGSPKKAVTRCRLKYEFPVISQPKPKEFEF